MKVILAGYSKTGTKTMHAALHALGYKVFDYLENLLVLHEDWNRIFEKGVQPGDLERIYEGVDAVIDTPCFYYWKEFSEAFPEAKIILCLRDEEGWFKSMHKQMEKMNSSWLWWLMSTLTWTGIRRRRYRSNIFKFLGETKSWPNSGLVLRNENTLKRLYREHNLYVQTTAPKDKLLIYRVTDGWKPLCDFLGAEIPDQPFPHKNKGADLFEEYRKTNDLVKSVEREAKISLLMLVAVFAFFVYQLYSFLSV